MKDLIINFTPTGMVPTKAMTPHVPIDVAEIVEQVLEAAELGITIAHLHARDPESSVPTYQKAVYGKIVDGIRRHAPELVICLSLSGRFHQAFEQRSEALDLKPDMASLTLSSMNFARSASVNAPDMIGQLAEKMLACGVKAELEVFDLGMINYAHYLIGKKRIEAPYYFNIILGNVAGLQLNASHVGAAIADLPEESLWALGGIGKDQLRANVLGIALGGGVRVGLEDNVFYDQNRLIQATNLSLLKRIHDMADMFERQIMSPAVFGGLGFYNTQR